MSIFFCFKFVAEIECAMDDSFVDAAAGGETSEIVVVFTGSKWESVLSAWKEIEKVTKNNPKYHENDCNLKQCVNTITDALFNNNNKNEKLDEIKEVTIDEMTNLMNEIENEVNVSTKNKLEKKKKEDEKEEELTPKVMQFIEKPVLLDIFVLH